MEHKCDPLSKNKDNNTPLHFAALNGRLAVVKYFIEDLKCDPNSRGQWGRISLHHASENGHLDVIQYLIDTQHCDPSCTDEDKYTLLHHASLNGHLATVKCLTVEHKCDPLSKNKDSNTPLHFAALNGRLAVIKYFIEDLKCDPNSRGQWGRIPLHHASQNGHFNVIQYLVDIYHCDPLCTDENKKSSLDIAILKSDSTTINFLKKALKDTQNQKNSQKLESSEFESEGMTGKLVRMAKSFLTTKRSTDNEENLPHKEKVSKQIDTLEVYKKRAKEAEGKYKLLKKRLEEVVLQKEKLDEENAERLKELEQNYKLRELEQIAEYEQRLRQQKLQLERETEQRCDAIIAECEEREQRYHERAAEYEQRLQLYEEQLSQLETQWVVRREEIQLAGPELGRGGWATVSVALFRGTCVAAKVIHHQILSQHNRQLFKREMNMAARIRHPNLIQFIGATLRGEMVILTELMPTSLRKELEKEDQDLSMNVLTSICVDVAKALNYLHLIQPEPIIHRDISSANVLLEPLPNSRWRAKVADYGSVNLLHKVQTTGPGNPTYAAPEASDPQQQSPKMDIFSFGILIMEMFTGVLPPPEERFRLMSSIKHPLFLFLVKRCLKQKIQDRPTASDIISELGKV